jgi:hypothetical protein
MACRKPRMVGLVDHDATRMGRKERFRIGLDQGQVLQALQRCGQRPDVRRPDRWGAMFGRT